MRSRRFNARVKLIFLLMANSSSVSVIGLVVRLTSRNRFQLAVALIIAIRQNKRSPSHVADPMTMSM